MSFWHPPSETPRILATLAYRGLTLALALLAVGGQVAYLDALYWHPSGLSALGNGALEPALRSSVLTGATVTVLVAGAGLFLAFRSDGERGARPFGLTLAAWGYLLAYSGLTILLAPQPEAAARPLFDAHFLVVEALALASLLRFSALFPVPLRREALRDPASLNPLLRPLQGLRIWLLSPSRPWVAGAVACALILAFSASQGHPVQDAPLVLPADLFRISALTLVILNLRSAFLATDTPGRRAGLWFVVGFTLLLGAVGVLVGGNVLTAVTGWAIPGFNWRPAVLDLGVVGLLWGASMGIAYRGNRRPGPLGRGAAILAAAVTLGLLLAAGLETLFTRIVASPVVLPRGVGTLVALAATGSLYVRVRRPLGEFLYRGWADVPEEAGKL